MCVYIIYIYVYVYIYIDCNIPESKRGVLHASPDQSQAAKFARSSMRSAVINVFFGSSMGGLRGFRV